MFVPLHDRNALKVIPFQAVTIGVMAVCIVAFLYIQSLDQASQFPIYKTYGFVPAYLFTLYDFGRAAMTMVTSLFLHGDWMHLIVNMLYLWVFGDNVEDAMGHLRFFAFYLICGIVGVVAHGVFNPDSLAPALGASGAISGVLAAYLLLHPRTKVLILILYRLPLRLPAYVVLVAWVLLQTFQITTQVGAIDGVAWLAHAGGFAAGLLLVVPFKRKDVPLLAEAEEGEEDEDLPAKPTPKRRKTKASSKPAPKKKRRQG